MKVSHQMLFFASFLVVFENAKALEGECDVCHVNYYHKVRAYYYLLYHARDVIMFLMRDDDDDGVSPLLLAASC